MVILAVNCVRVTPVMKLMVIPEPRLTVEKPAWKVVNWPVMTTLSVVPACPLLGAAVRRAGMPGSTVKPPVIEAISVPVVTVTLREPVVPAGSTVILARMSVGLFTCTELTVMPAPKLAVLHGLAPLHPVPLKCVNWPVIST